MFRIALVILALSLGAASAKDLQTAIFAGGCFWCSEANFEHVPGVTGAVSGYTGGTLPDPTYKQVSAGGTGHYEAVEVTYDADRVSYAELLRIFFRSIDPLDAGGQFCDRGQQYASAVFPATPDEERLAVAAKADAGRELHGTIATKIQPAGPFYPAEAYHQDFYKSTDRIWTRFGWIRKADAYKRYRLACGRDARVEKLWGAEAYFTGS